MRGSKSDISEPIRMGRTLLWRSALEGEERVAHPAAAVVGANRRHVLEPWTLDHGVSVPVVREIDGTLVLAVPRSEQLDKQANGRRCEDAIRPNDLRALAGRAVARGFAGEFFIGDYPH